MSAHAALLLAAGRSERMAGQDKTTIPLAGLPLAAHSLRAFAACDAITTIVLVSGPHNHNALLAIAHDHGRGKVIAVVPGGNRRQDSVAKGLAALSADQPQPPDLVAIHDTARPLVTADIIERGLRLAAQHGAAVAAAPLRDTIKAINPDATAAADAPVQRTVDRSTLRAAQTPQTFRWSLLQRAHTAPSHTVTDDAMLVEALGEPVILYDAGAPNPKVTTPDDLVIVEALLHARTSAAAANP